MKRKIDLVYGGGSVGLMGLISRRVYEGGFHVLGLVLLQSPFISKLLYGFLIGFYVLAASFPRL